MDAKRNDLKKLAKEGLVDVNPELVDDLMDEVVQKYFDDYEEESNKRQRF